MRRAALAGLAEIAVAVGLASALIALIDPAAPAAGLGVIYLLAVLAVAIRRGGAAALVTALASALAFNFLFIEPRYRLEVARSQDVVALAVLLICAVVVGRLASMARSRARDAEERTRVAVAREREAQALARASSAVLAAQGAGDAMGLLARAVESASPGALRVVFGSAPRRPPEQVVVPLSGARKPGWLIGDPRAGWDRDSLRRIAEPLGQLMRVARERERAAAELAEAEARRRAETAKTALLHAISHDLRSPLTAITTAIEALREPRLRAGDRAALLEVLDTESRRLAQLVDDLLDLSRIEAGAAAPRKDWCDVREIAERAAAQVRERRGDHPVLIELPPELPLVRADPVQLERVLVNLLDNAVKFSPPEEPVRVSGGAQGDRVHVRVTDRGSGIPLSRRPRVFEPFYRGRPGGEGAGLGLAICRGFVEANGGEIRLEGDSERGTSFTVSFPLERQPAPVS